MQETAREQLRQSLREITDACAKTVANYEKSIAILEAELARDERQARTNRSASQGETALPVIDHPHFSVVHADRRCFLGNTRAFFLMDRLLQDCNQYVSVEDLLDDVWHGAKRTRTAVRSAVKILRRELRRARMGDIADAIIGRVAGHYAIVLSANL